VERVKNWRVVRRGDIACTCKSEGLLVGVWGELYEGIQNIKPHRAHLWGIKKLWVVLLAPLAVPWFVFTSRAAAEVPTCKVVRTDAKFEIRDYPAFEE